MKSTASICGVFSSIQEGGEEEEFLYTSMEKTGWVNRVCGGGEGGVLGRKISRLKHQPLQNKGFLRVVQYLLYDAIYTLIYKGFKTHNDTL
jgi:hypothetical protein